MAQFLDSDPYPNTGPQPDSFTVSVDGGANVAVGLTTNPDFSVYMHYDVSAFSVGSHSASVVAVSALWGDSAPVVMSFTVGGASTSINVFVVGVAAAGAVGNVAIGTNAQALPAGLSTICIVGNQDTRALRSPVAAGYVLSGTASAVVVDQAVALRDCVCDPHRVTIVMADGSLESRYLLATCDSATTFEVEVPFSTTPPVGARWILTDGYEVGAGHIVSGTVNHIVLDSGVALDICEDYTLTTFMPDGTLVEAQDTLTDCDDDALALDLEANLTTAPDPGWIWVLRSADVGWEDTTVIALGVQCLGIVQSPTAVTIPGEAAVFGITIFCRVGTVTTKVDINVAATGRSATGSVGAITFREDQLVAVTGLAATSSLGSVTATVTTGAIVNVTGLSATGALGAVVFASNQSVSVTGLQASVLGGVVLVDEGAGGVAPVFGVSAVCSVGVVAVSLAPNLSVTGLAATGGLGSVSVIATGDTVIPVLGLQSVCAVDDVSTSSDQNVMAESLEFSGFGSVGSVLEIGQGAAPEPLGVRALCQIGTPVARASTERNRVLHVVRTRPGRVLRVSISTDGLPFKRSA